MNAPEKEIDLLPVLRERFGLEAFRPGQERIIRSLLAGRDVLAVLPTGAGKSLVYQLAAQLLPGVTIVVSPLLALMKDQVASLEARGVEVGVINSALSQGAAASDLERVRRGTAKLLYVTPERFENESFMADVAGLRVSLLVVDEAHCVSEWGYSFRPAYLGLGRAAAALGGPTLMALTATATPWVRRDIVERLGLRAPLVAVHDVQRPNLFLEGWRVEDERDDRRVLQRLLTAPADAGVHGETRAAALTAAMQGAGIIYTATTKAAEETAVWLGAWGIPAGVYHGQRKKADRERVQEAFMAGEVRVMAATNAFGLGVDKPDVRFVVHRDVPASLEAYYQEAGRAGRDGDLARCVLIYRPADLGRAAFLGSSGHLTREHLHRMREGLRARPDGTLRELEATTGLSKGSLLRAIDLLKREGIVAERRRRIRLLRPDFDPDAVSLEREERRLAYEHSRLEMMRGYAELRACRQSYLLSYFGEATDGDDCRMCDHSVGQSESGTGPSRPAVSFVEPPRREGDAVSAAAGARLLTTGDRVAHDAWGEGTVQRLEADTVTVLFDTTGYKKLLTAGAIGNGLLRPVAAGTGGGLATMAPPAAGTTEMTAGPA